MSDSDKDTSSAVDKAVGAFRAQREQGKSDAAASSDPADTAAADAGDEQESASPSEQPTRVVKLEKEADDVPEPAGGSSESPTRAFQIPTEVAAAAAAEDADEPSSDGLVEEAVVGDPTVASDDEDETAASDDPEVAEKADIVEESISVADAAETADEDETASDDAPSEAPTQKISAEQVAAAAAATAGSEAPTAKVTVPPQARQAPPADRQAPAPTPAPTPTQDKPAPQVVAPAGQQPTGNKRGKLIAILIAVVVVIAAIAVGLWYIFVGSTPEQKAADAAKDYQSAMNDGDLGKLRDITCGEKKAYYDSVSDDDFNKAYQAQKSTNQLMTFDDVKAVSIDGDTARVGVDMYHSGKPGDTVPAQITLHKSGDDWKVCQKP